jgi:hypothetical protein
MSELPMDLQQLETVRGAFEILKYLDDQADNAADGDDIMDDLDLSSRGFDKAKRRLVTRGYIQMRSDYSLELTPKGSESAAILKEYGGDDSGGNDGAIERQLVVVLPRNLVLAQTSPLQIGIEPSDEFEGDTSVIVRVSATYADLGDFNEMATLSANALVLETTITPQNYDHARIKVEVYMLSAGGDELKACGGIYVDIVVLASGNTGESIAYGGDLSFMM